MSDRHRLISDFRDMKTGIPIVDEGYVFQKETLLTVMKTSLFFPGDGFAVYDCGGQLVFRVDSYGPDSRDAGELVLMDSDGRCLLTVRRKVCNQLFLFSTSWSRTSKYLRFFKID